MDGHKEKAYRNIYIVQPSHDFAGLKLWAKDLRYITTGYESAAELEDRIRSVLENFDPHQDAIVAVGRSNAVLVTGIVLRSMFPDADITFGVYKSRMPGRASYSWEKISAHSATL